MTSMHPSTDIPQDLSDEQLDLLDALLTTLREQDEEVPDWEFCDGFLTALACTRRPIATHDWLALLVGELDSFPSKEAQDSFTTLTAQRLAQIRYQLDLPIEHLEDPQAFQPQVLDTRGAILAMPPEEQSSAQAELEEAEQTLPALGQVWTLGFMYAVENWAEEWQPPRDKEAAAMLEQTMQAVMALLEDDTHPAAHNLYDDAAPASTSQQRVDAYAEAIWAIYDLRQLWRSLGPRVEAIVRPSQPGRNDPCSCGSGKKYKKCCGA